MAMNRRLWVLAIVTALAVVAVERGAAHHAISAKFDDTKPTTLTGIVTLVDWANPHVHVYVNVKDARGQVLNWAVELESPIDLQQSGWDTASDAGIPESIGVELEDIGAPDTNLGVTSLRVEGADAVAVVQNFSARPATDQVIFAVDTRRIGAVPVTLAAGATVEARVPLEGVASGGLSASITDRDGYTADNVRYAVLDAADAVSVLAVTPTGHPSEALYLERALTVAEGTRGFRFRSIGGGGFTAIDPKALEQVGVIAVLSTRAVAQRGRERLAEFEQVAAEVLEAALVRAAPVAEHQLAAGQACLRLDDVERHQRAGQRGLALAVDFHRRTRSFDRQCRGIAHGLAMAPSMRPDAQGLLVDVA